jgi:hypothetical protein
MAKDNEAIRRRQGQIEARVNIVMDSLVSRHPHLRAAHDAMRYDDAKSSHFAKDALTSFRQRFQD